MKKITVAKGISIPKPKLARLRKQPGGSNAGKYPGLKLSDFAGGKKNPYSFPINTRKRAKAALSYARNSQNPGSIIKKACSRYPGLCSKKS